jgi:probable 2-oxoglutarate dehydrogenase E1 component DHKTD1
LSELDPARYGLKETGESYKLKGILHMSNPNDPSSSLEEASIEAILEHLKNTYTGRIGFEYAHLPVNQSLNLGSRRTTLV